MLPKKQAEFLFGSLRKAYQELEQTEENQQMVNGLCNNMGWNQDIREYIMGSQ